MVCLGGRVLLEDTEHLATVPLARESIFTFQRQRPSHCVYPAREEEKLAEKSSATVWLCGRPLEPLPAPARINTNVSILIPNVDWNCMRRCSGSGIHSHEDLRSVSADPILAIMMPDYSTLNHT